MLDRIPAKFVDTGKLPNAPHRFTLRKWWLNALLLGVTFLTTSAFGVALQRSFRAGRDLSTADWLAGLTILVSGDRAIWSGVSYSIPVLLILLAHELGHYSMCRRWNVDATLPYFGPSPSLMGTVGAFIWIRSPIYRRRALLDIGISGPIAGFLTLLPFLVVGIWKSRIVPGLPVRREFSFGVPPLFHILEAIRFPGIPAHTICLHPMAMAAWAGLLATAINLMPVGQLDGGHIVYAALGERAHRYTSLVVVALLVVGGFLYWPWWGWAIAMFFFRRHPLVHDNESIGWERQSLCLVTIVLLLLAFTVVPVTEG